MSSGAVMSESSDRSTMKLWKWFCQEVAKSFRVYSRAGLAHGEMVVIAEIQLPAFLHKGVQRLVGLAVGLDNVVVEHQIIAGPVAHQDVAVAVKDITTGGTDGGNGGVFAMLSVLPFVSMI